MKFNNEKYSRKSTRLKGHNYSFPGAYFVTICTQDRECIFGDVIDKRMVLNNNGNIARHLWFKLSKTFANIKSPTFVVMPNHIHGIIIIQRQIKNHIPQNTKNQKKDFLNEKPSMNSIEQPEWSLMKNPSLTLGKIVRFYKAQVTRRIRQNSDTYFRWQKNYYEEIIRNNRELEQKRIYILENPSNWEEDTENPKNKTP